jgi:hypothetical protein
MAQDPSDTHCEVRFVKGEARVSLASEALRPAERFQRSVCCQGKLLEMRRSHGWIQPLQLIQHPNAHLNGGNVYVSAEDMRPGVALRPGDLVIFFLYVDSRGLGAEDCFPVRSAVTHRKRVAALSSSADATPFGSPASTATCVPSFDVNDDSLDECTSQAAASASTATSPPVAAEASMASRKCKKPCQISEEPDEEPQ